MAEGTAGQMTGLMAAWMAGMAASRGAEVETGPQTAGLPTLRFPHRPSETVLDHPDEETLARGLELVAGHAQWWLTVVGREGVRPRRGTRVGATGEQLMRTTLTPLAPSSTAPPALLVRREAGPAVYRTALLDGEAVVAEGSVGLVGDLAVPDMVGTAPAYRGRGLARWVMADLTREALDRGATQGLLIASPMGRGLYRRLGWYDAAPLSTIAGCGPARLRRARTTEHAEVSALALTAKAHWGYDAAFLAACREELTWTADQVRGVVVAEVDGRMAGIHHLAGEELAALFVQPDYIGTGLGGLLLRDAVSRARADGVRVLRVESDPQAEPFYRHHGAVRVGDVPSGSVPGRLLPLLELPVPVDGPE